MLVLRFPLSIQLRQEFNGVHTHAAASLLQKLCLEKGWTQQVST